MTRGEAAASLKTLCNTCKLYPQCAYKKPECFKAIEMAISALEQPEQHFCRDCKFVEYFGNVDKYGNVESSWYCCNWDGRTDEEGYCHEWGRRE